MAINSGRKKPDAYVEYDLDNVTDYMDSMYMGLFKKFIDGLNPDVDDYESLKEFKDVLVGGHESWRKFNDLSSKTVIDNTGIPVFKPYWFDSDEQTES